ncbi:hypothetical protein Vi05172_g2618 [Venturia inaequalis]|nr:hypothetical protein Vi05172_g2618 [Venturia inaequalis]
MLKELASVTTKPKVCILGRSASIAEGIISGCRVLNPQGEHMFAQKELDLKRNDQERRLFGEEQTWIEN